MSLWVAHGIVRRALNGSTFIVDVDLGWGVWLHHARVELVGVEVPSTRNSDIGKEAREEARSFEGRRVQVTSHDFHHRKAMVEMVTDDGVDIAQHLVMMGYAVRL